MPAYLARPAAAGTYPGVIIGFEMFGVTGYVRRVADRVARLGYAAVVPDCYHRFGRRIALPADAQGRARGLELLQAMGRDGVVRDVRSTLGYLSRGPDGDPRAVLLGLSVGGHIAYYAATEVPVNGLVAFYPGWLTDTGIALSRPEPTLTLTAGIAALGTRVLVLLGGQDHLYTPEQRDLIAERLRESGVRHEMVVYPHAPHGFCCDERDSYRPAEAADAWARVTALLADELGPIDHEVPARRG